MLYSFWCISVAYFIIIEIVELLNERAGDLAPIDQRVRRCAAPAGGRQPDRGPHRPGNWARTGHIARHSQWKHRAYQRKHAKETGRLLQPRRGTPNPVGLAVEPINYRIQGTARRVQRDSAHDADGLSLHGSGVAELAMWSPHCL